MDLIRGLKAAVYEGESVHEVIEKIDSLGIAFVAVLDQENKLIGVLTDADVRRAILKGIKKEDTVEKIMNKDFISAKEGISQVGIENLMRVSNKNQIPLISKNGEFIDVIAKSDFAEPIISNQVIIFAGGFGSRLRPLTKDIPKPMLKIDNKPILEIMIDNLLRFGVRRIIIALNYKGEIIENHFGDGTKWGCEILYLREEKKLGTAGALSLLKPRPESPFFVMNADLLTKVNLNHILDFHSQHDSIATVCVSQYDVDVPYGVINTKNEYLFSIDEKPRHSFYVNAGIYLIEPKALDFVPKSKIFDMTDLLKIFLSKKINTSVYPITDYWIDIGHLSDYDRAKNEYNHYFNNQ